MRRRELRAAAGGVAEPEVETVPRPVAGELSTEQMRDVAMYYESLGALTP